MRLYDHPALGNCLKVRVLLRQLGISYETVVVDLFAGETKAPEHLARNPNGRVPVLELDSGETLPESAAIMLYLAEGTPFLPSGRFERAQVHRWLFFEQNQVEPSLAVGSEPAAPWRPFARDARTRARRRPGVHLRPRLLDRRHRAPRVRPLRRRRPGRPARARRHRGLARSRRGDPGLRQRPRAVSRARAALSTAASATAAVAAYAGQRYAVSDAPWPSSTCGGSISQASR